MYTSSRWRHTRAMASASLMRPTHSRWPFTLRNTSHIIQSLCSRIDIDTPMRVSWMAQPSVGVHTLRSPRLGSIVGQSSVGQSSVVKTTRGKGGNFPHYSQPLAFAPKFTPPHPRPNDNSQKIFIKNFIIKIVDFLLLKFFI